MHYHCEVILNSLENLDEKISNLMAPYYEGREVEKYVYKTKQQVIDTERRRLEEMKQKYDEYKADPEEYKKDCVNTHHLEYLENEFMDRYNQTDEEIYQRETEYFEPEDLSPYGGFYSTTPPNVFWDWYVIGGRWTGEKLDGYNPAKDDRNLEECWLCKGTGTRTDGMNGPGGCNGCDGTGKSLKSPTKWVSEGNIAPVSELSDELGCYTLIVEGHGVFHKEIWNSATSNFEVQEFTGNVKEKLKELGISDGYAVTVDYHS